VVIFSLALGQLKTQKKAGRVSSEVIVKVWLKAMEGL
jgi:hypothetical protein